MHAFRFTMIKALGLLLALLLLIPAASAQASAQGKKILLIVAKADFEQSEYSNTRSTLEDAGAICTVASTKIGTLKGNKGKRIESELELTQVQTAEYDGVVVIGGNGIKKEWKNEDAHRILREAQQQGKIIGAICAGPGVLAYAGVLDGKNATAHPKSGASFPMKDHGCSYTKKSVVVDGNIVTADGPKSAKAFGKALVEVLSN
ncbi:DJ-1/PfpI family protein [Desulfovibrio ferrophilus]|uniref:ThiJ/PfpI domain-containing protein n=1 Tax=Desulfovibrio ferrophilus TaxID=241368 RepID=A0A2Z6AY93_9BACT|nr:DJ-1/PfpI family protein [Desulfovibrio ferrophilus]BBD08116.1 ThiJ/PfpI domain-containing protein [Desulfovibrio ferrophilus]